MLILEDYHLIHIQLCLNSFICLFIANSQLSIILNLNSQNLSMFKNVFKFLIILIDSNSYLISSHQVKIMTFFIIIHYLKNC